MASIENKKILKDQLQDELERVYGNRFENKYILVLKEVLNFLSDEYRKIRCNVYVESKERGIERVTHIKVRQPYPNDRLNLISSTYGRKIFKYGIPFVLDKNELDKLENIIVKWEVCDNYTEEIYELRVIYNIERINIKDNKRFYVIANTNSMLGEKEIEKKIILEPHSYPRNMIFKED